GCLYRLQGGIRRHARLQSRTDRARASAGEFEEGRRAESLGVRAVEAVIGREIVVEPYPRIEAVKGEGARDIRTPLVRQGAVIPDVVPDPIPARCCCYRKAVPTPEEAFGDLQGVLDEQADGVLPVGDVRAQRDERAFRRRILPFRSRLLYARGEGLLVLLFDAHR